MEFWESSFQSKQAMWGLEPANTAIETAALFQREGLSNILIPGFGYGRNAKVFIDTGFLVTGIEISETAISLAKKHYGVDILVHHGAVVDMPYDKALYDGIFCYALVHLLDEVERAKLIGDCFSQLTVGGLMVFTAISKSASTYQQGQKVAKDTFLTQHGVRLFFYDQASIEEEFGPYGLLGSKEVQEPVKHAKGKLAQSFWQITCRK